MNDSLLCEALNFLYYSVVCVRTVFCIFCVLLSLIVVSVDILFSRYLCMYMCFAKDVVIAETHLPPTSLLLSQGGDDRLLDIEDDRPDLMLASLELFDGSDGDCGDDVKLLQP